MYSSAGLNARRILSEPEQLMMKLSNPIRPQAPILVQSNMDENVESHTSVQKKKAALAIAIGHFNKPDKRSCVATKMAR